MVFKNSKKILEIKRQLFHLFFGILIVILYYFDHIGPSDVFFATIVGLLVFALNKHRKIKMLDFFLNHFERPETTHEGIGILNYLIGVFLTMVIFSFDKNIALASLTILAVGDSISPIVGIWYGKTKHRFFNEKKYLEGIFFGIICATLLAWIFVPFIHSFIASSIAMIIEGLELKYRIDDNISIPLIAGLVLALMALV